MRGAVIFSLTIFLLALLLSSPASRAELLVAGRSVASEYYSHPSLRSLVFVTPETRAQAILPPAPVFVAPAPLIWRAPSGALPSPPATLPGFNRSGAPANRDLAAYSVARAQAMRQDLHRKNGAIIWFGPVYPDDWFWFGASPYYSPPAPGLTRPGNRDNARQLVERAHRFSQDAYHKP